MKKSAAEVSFERGAARLYPCATALLVRCLCAVSLTLTVLGLFLLAVSRSTVGVPVYAGAPVYDYWLENTVIAIGFSTVGAIITSRLPPQNPIGWIGEIRRTLTAPRAAVDGPLPRDENIIRLAPYLVAEHGS